MTDRKNHKEHKYIQLGCFQFSAEQTSEEKDINVTFRLVSGVSSKSETLKIVCSTESTKLFSSSPLIDNDVLVACEGYARSNAVSMSSGST
jgi:hypothetical protein